MRTWLESGRPKIFHLPAFYFPQGFMTAVLQLHARKYCIAINTLKFTFELLDQKTQTQQCETMTTTNQPEEVEDEAVEKTTAISKYDDGVLCSGMYLEGARVSSLQNENEKEILILDDQLPRQLVSEMPVIHFLPEPNHVVSDDIYVCPVYKVSTRQGVLSTTGMSTNFVVSIELPRGAKTTSYWILRGTAALLNLDT